MITAEECLVDNDVFSKSEISNFNLIIHRDCYILAQNNIKRSMIEFAKLHVKAALKQASENVEMDTAFDYGRFNEKTAEFNKKKIKLFYRENYGHGDCGYEACRPCLESILNAYPDSNIK